MLLQLIVFPCLFVVLNTQICHNLYLVKFNRFAHTCIELINLFLYQYLCIIILILF